MKANGSFPFWSVMLTILITFSWKRKEGLLRSILWYLVLSILKIEFGISEKIYVIFLRINKNFKIYNFFYPFKFFWHIFGTLNEKFRDFSVAEGTMWEMHFVILFNILTEKNYIAHFILWHWICLNWKNNSRLYNTL